MAATDAYRQRHPEAVDAVELGNIRTVVAVPMLKGDEPIGVIAIHRPEVALFNEKQIGGPAPTKRTPNAPALA